MSNDIKFGAALNAEGDDVEFARKLEALGFDSVWVGDHPQNTEGYTYLAAMAGATSKITVGSRVIVLPLREPLMNAKMATQIDRISGGRFIYGVGIGGEGNDDEFPNLGVPLKERGRRGNENLEVMMKLFTEENVNFDGKYYHVRNLTLNPKPIQRPHPPIWMGGRAPEAVARAAKYADGWFPNLNTVDGLRERVKEIKRQANELKRDMSDFKIGIVARTFVGPNHDVAHAEAAARGVPPGTRTSTDWDAMVDRYAAHGTGKDIIEYCERYIAEGASHFVFNMYSPPERMDHDLEVLKTDVLPYFRDRG